MRTYKERHTEGVSSLTPETKEILWVIFLCILGVLSILAFFGAAGAVGRIWKLFLATFFGRLDVAVPLFVFAIVASHIFPQRFFVTRSQWWGSALLLLSLAALFHLRIPEGEGLAYIGEEKGGGYIGLLISYPLRTFAGTWGALVILFGLGMAGLVLLFNMTAQSVTWPGRALRYIMTQLFSMGARIRQVVHDRLHQEEHAHSDDTAFFARQEFTPREVPSGEMNLHKEDALQEERLALPGAVVQESPLDASKSQGKLFASVKRRPKVEIPLDLLTMKSGKPTSGDIEANKETIKRTFANFHIEVEMGEISIGPTVTQFTLRPSMGVKVSQITSLANDLALALAAHPIRIEAPIPGKSLVGIEVPNQQVALVPLKDCLISDAFKKRKSTLSFAVGKDVAGTSWIADLGKMPHLLIAGATGSGKSVMINSLIVSLLYQNQPEDMRFIMVDPKRVELSVYNDIPHLLTPVVTEVDRTINALRWVVGEMDRRFQQLSKVGKRNIEAYNSITENRLPYIVVIIDELADLMAVAAAEVEAAIIRLAQMARAVGIHLVVATQRPSVDVITGLIKANITARIAFAVASTVDSRTILDASGAEKLLGRGDLLFTTAELSKPRRLQGAYVNDQEIERVVAHWKEHGGTPEYHEEIVVQAVPSGSMNGAPGGSDPRLGEARDLVVHAGKASASLLQRRMSIGYARAARLLDLLEEEGTIGPGDGAKARDILLRPEDLRTHVHEAGVSEDYIITPGSGSADGSVQKMQENNDVTTTHTENNENRDEEGNDFFIDPRGK